ncbi:MAG TPA: DUF4038 domain-containing protein [Candidatus Acidoferrum sp.]|nr:DUF4038 domain-containing protein [Candidatus Acidoferrum sp.]
MKPSANGRYLVDQDNVPFLIIGDAPHSLIVNTTIADAALYLRNRASNGINTLWVELLCTGYVNGRPDGSMLDGTVPFTNRLGGGAYDLTTPNESYFSYVDAIVQMAATNGIQLLLDSLETGDWTSVALANGTSRCRQYGQYLGDRYKRFTNLIWITGNDFQTWRTPTNDAVVTSVALGIKDRDTSHLQTSELDYSVSQSLDDPNWWPIISLNAIYSYYPSYSETLNGYNQANFVPVYFLEGHYEYENVAGEMGTPNVLRRQEYWSLLSGANGGYMSGNYWTWTFNSGWQSYLNSPGVAQLRHAKYLIQLRRWFDLIPDQDHKLLTTGYGTFSDSGNVSDNDFATTARTADGNLAISYLPTLRTITVDMTRMAGNTTARWFDPTAGTYSPIIGSPFPNTGTVDFTPTGNNGGGEGDWVLVLETEPTETQPPTVTLVSPSAGAVLSNVVAVSATVTGDVEVLGVQFQVDGANLGAEVLSPPYAIYWDSTTLTNGVHKVQAIARDAVGNRATNGVSVTVSDLFPPPPPAFVQQNYVTPQTPQRMVTLDYSTPQTAGNANILAIGWSDTAASISAVNDSAGNVYEVALPTNRGNGLSQAIYYAPNISAGTNTITVTFDQAAGYVDLRATEYAGLARANPLDVGNCGTGTGTSANSGMVKTVFSNELLFGAGVTAGAFTGAGGGFTAQVITSPDGDIIEDMVAIAPGLYSATATLNSGAWLMQVAAFKSAVARNTLAPQIVAFTFRGSDFVLSFSTVSGQNYELQTSADVASGLWSALATNILGTGGIVQIADTNAVSRSQRFYRVKTDSSF